MYIFCEAFIICYWEHCYYNHTSVLEPFSVCVPNLQLQFSTRNSWQKTKNTKMTPSERPFSPLSSQNQHSGHFHPSMPPQTPIKCVHEHNRSTLKIFWWMTSYRCQRLPFWLLFENNCTLHFWVHKLILWIPSLMNCGR